MDPSGTLFAQAKALHADVQREYDRARAAAGNPGAVPAGIADDTLKRLATKLDAQRQKLENLLRFLAASSDLAVERKQFRVIQTDCRDLFGECLAVATARAVRSLNLDGGACDSLERFLRGLGKSFGVPWLHLTSLSEAEFFATASQVIRLRYPVSSVWDFPVAAHEFGHFIGPGWRSDNGEASGYQTFMGVQDLEGSRDHLNEYFADMFATYVLGPAYVNTCLLHRFDPAGKDDPTHPSDPKRAVWILRGLQFLIDGTDKETSGRLESTYHQRCNDWNNAVAANGGEPLDSKTTVPLEERARDLCRALREWAGDVGFRDIRGALKLRAAFVENPNPGYVTTPLKIRDVLNAAWLLRQDQENDLGKAAMIDHWARALCSRAPE